VIRKPAVAGAFYPDNKEALTAQIDNFLDTIIVKDYGDPIGFVCPHAGYIYSGLTAAYSYKYLIGREYEKVIILAPSHHDGFHGITTWDGSGLETPLGVVETDDSDTLLKYGVKKSRLGFGKEHSLEVQLPFLQRVLKKGWKVVPLVMGFQNHESITLGRNILHDYISKKNLVIISSDLSHFHSYDKAKIIDGHFLNFIELDRIQDLYDAHENGLVEACGFGPIMSFLNSVRNIYKKSIKPKVLNYTNSGDTAGDRSRVVGYTSIGAFWDD
jgi:AmmeMemoRadiSam system protein B